MGAVKQTMLEEMDKEQEEMDKEQEAEEELYWERLEEEERRIEQSIQDQIEGDCDESG